jgi:subtilisin family serine protease
MSLKDCNESGHPSIAGTGCALRYAADKGADVINMSVSFGFLSNFLKTSLDYAFGKGCVLVASMGNCEGGCDIIKYPAGYDSVIAVGATDWNDNRWYIDSWNGSSAGRHIDVVAPGVSIMTDLWVWYPPGLHEGYGYFNRTSASAPFVSGEASLIKGQYKKLYPSGVITNTDIRDIIRYSAEDSMYYLVSDTMWDDSLYGYGRINVFRALLAISRGEVNNDKSITISDVNYLIAYLMQGGPPPVPVREMADANCDGKLSLGDVVWLINYLFKGGPKPPFCYRWQY